MDGLWFKKMKACYKLQGKSILSLTEVNWRLDIFVFYNNVILKCVKGFIFVKSLLYIICDLNTKRQTL